MRYDGRLSFDLFRNNILTDYLHPLELQSFLDVNLKEFVFSIGLKLNQMCCCI